MPSQKCRPSTQMEVSMPQFLVGFKCDPQRTRAALLRQSTSSADMACDVLLGDSSPLYQRLYDEGLINSELRRRLRPAARASPVLCAGGESGAAARQVERRDLWKRRSASRARASTLTFYRADPPRELRRDAARAQQRLRTSPCRWRTAAFRDFDALPLPRGVRDSVDPRGCGDAFCARASSRQPQRACPFIDPQEGGITLPNELIPTQHISFPGLFGDWQLHRAVQAALNIGNGIYWYGVHHRRGACCMGLYGSA